MRWIYCDDSTKVSGSRRQPARLQASSRLSVEASLLCVARLWSHMADFLEEVSILETVVDPVDEGVQPSNHSWKRLRLSVKASQAKNRNSQ